MKRVLEVPVVLSNEAAAVLHPFGVRAGDTIYLTPERNLSGCIIRDLDAGQAEEIAAVADQLITVSVERPDLRLVP